MAQMSDSIKLQKYLFTQDKKISFDQKNREDYLGYKTAVSAGQSESIGIINRYLEQNDPEFRERVEGNLNSRASRRAIQRFNELFTGGKDTTRNRLDAVTVTRAVIEKSREEQASVREAQAKADKARDDEFKLLQNFHSQLSEIRDELSARTPAGKELTADLAEAWQRYSKRVKQYEEQTADFAKRDPSSTEQK